MNNRKNNRKWLLIIILLSVSNIFGQQVNTDNKSQEEPRGIVGGSIALSQTYPWMTTTIMNNGQPGCGATLIRPSWVLTAGHCSFTFPNGAVIDRVIINSLTRNFNILEPYSELIDVDSVIKHPDFSLSAGGPDLALLHLRTSSSIPTIELAEYSDSNSYAGNMPAKVLGWGLTVAGGNLEDSLRVVDCIFVSDDTCATLYNSSSSPIFGSNPDGQICAGFFSGSSPAGAGAGDSGGPLFFQNNAGDYKQVGIVSGGNSDVTTEDYPGIFTLIPKHRDWIEDVIANYEISLSIEEPSGKEIEIKHLSNQNIQIAGLREGTNYTISLLDITGRQVYSRNITGNLMIDLSLNNYTSGLYVVMVQNNCSSNIRTRKIIIK